MIPDHWLVDGISVALRRSPRSRRLVLKLDPLLGPVAILPPKVSLAQTISFLERNKVWLHNRLALIPSTIPFADGTTLPILGIPHQIRHHPTARRGVWIDEGALYVSGQAEYLPRRTQDFLKAQALHHIRPQAHDLAARIGHTPSRITIRSLKSRWGSCSITRDLSFSWRLVMAPPHVLTYVVAHEVAHMAHMNHSDAFWQVVETLCPGHQTPKRWLKKNGMELFRYGG